MKMILVVFKISIENKVILNEMFYLIRKICEKSFFITEFLTMIDGLNIIASIIFDSDSDYSKELKLKMLEKRAKETM